MKYTYIYIDTFKTDCLNSSLSNSLLFNLTGLLDADQDFEAKLNSLKEVWDSREGQYLPHGVAPKFHDYILERVSRKF